MQVNLKPHYSNYQANKFPTITKPKIIGYFSINDDREYQADHSRLQYLKCPSKKKDLDLNLNSGFESVIPKPECDEKINFLLKYILNNINTLKTKESELLPYNFVCFRGLLRLLMCTPYENNASWIILATKWKGTIYLCAMDTEEKKMRDANETEQSKRFCYYGFKFEQYFLTSHPEDEPNTSKPIALSNEFCSMFETDLESNKVMYGAEMDGIISDSPIPTDANLNDLEFVELKVKRKETHFRQKINFYKYKSIKWWSQSFLVGIKTLIVGLRNDDGIVEAYEEIDVRNIARESRDHWSPAVCMKFCAEFLRVVRNDMKQVNCPHTVMRYSYFPEDHSNIEREIMKGRNELEFLPEWYCNEIVRMSSLL